MLTNPKATTLSSSKSIFDSDQSKNSTVEKSSTLLPVQSGIFLGEVNADSSPSLRVKEEDLKDDVKDIITLGSKCKRKSCEAEYKDESSRAETCTFHSGAPLFHEGSKGKICVFGGCWNSDLLF